MNTKTVSRRPKQVGTLYFYLTAAVAGAAVMIVEVLGASMLAPFLGTSHYVWSAQIAVTLLALATGYYMGGYIADRVKRLERLYEALFIGALMLLVPAVFRGAVAFWALRFDLAPASLLTAGILFFIPLTLLAAVVPYLIRFVTRSMESIGVGVGRLTAVGTVGSLIGTLIAGYIMIPMLTHEISLFLTAGLIAAVVSGYFLLSGRTVRALLTAGLFILFLMGANIAITSIKADNRYTHVVERFKKNSNYGRLQVLESRSGSWRVLLSDYLVQNQLDLRNGGKSLSVPPYLLHFLSRYYCRGIKTALCIGLGAGVVPGMLAREGVQVDVIEINPVMKEIAEDYFGFNPGDVTLTINDARFVLNKSKKRYDTVILDAFLGDAAPFHLMTREAFAAIRARLNPGGILIINTLGNFKSKNRLFTGSIGKTLNSVFPHVRIHGVDGREGGVYFVASDKKLQATSFRPDWSTVHPSCLSTVKQLFHTVGKPDPAGAVLLTDSYNPMPVMDAERRQSLRRHFFNQVMNL